MTTKLYVGNLSWSCTAEDLTQAFSQYGEVSGRRARRAPAAAARARRTSRAVPPTPPIARSPGPPPTRPPRSQVSDAFIPSDRETGR
jgi:RNA recognition motif-containing protein